MINLIKKVKPIPKSKTPKTIGIAITKILGLKKTTTPKAIIIRYKITLKNFSLLTKNTLTISPAPIKHNKEAKI